MEEQILAVDLSTEQTLEVNLPEQDNVAQIDVYWQDEVTLDLDASLMYIVSGQQEIQDYVENTSKPEINRYIDEYAKPIVSEVVDQIATPVIDEYFENTVKPSITEFAENEMAGYAATATTQAGIATEKANEASETAKIVDEKIQEFSQTTEASKNEFVNFAQEKTEEFEQTAITATEQAVGSAEHSRIWAEGEQEEVKPLGGELSSMGAADLAYAIANAPEDTPIDASGLFAMNVVKGEKGDKGDKGDKGEDGKDGVDGKSVFDGYTTNCITEMPQDIKLELKDGVLTLKAGSKVYVPNGFEADGSNRFDEVVIESDITKTANYGADNKMLVYVRGNLVDVAAVSIIKSGNAQPTETNNGFVWYDTANNVIKRYNPSNSTWEVLSNSFPIAEVQSTSNVVTSIDQIFNGFGYIGSTVFALPGVKCLIPNGRNADGSLRNEEFVTDKVLVNTEGTGFSGNYAEFIYNGTVIDGKVYSESETSRKASVGGIVYNTVDNIMYDSGGNPVEVCLYAFDTKTAGVISNFTPKLPFHAVDRNDSSWIAAQAMPSGKYIDLTLGASGSSYTAPANGWFYIGKRLGGTSVYELGAAIYDTANQVIMRDARLVSSGSLVATNALQLCVPIQKGNACKISYNLTGETLSFRFIYAEGGK